MAAEERVTIKTTVPQYQKTVWVEHADDLDMTQSEFVRTMVQTGRRGFELEPPETRSPDATPGVDGLRDQVLERLSSDEFVSFEQIVDPLIEDIEDTVDDILQSLMDENRVRYSGRAAGYALNGDEHGVD